MCPVQSALSVERAQVNLPNSPGCLQVLEGDPEPWQDRENPRSQAGLLTPSASAPHSKTVMLTWPLSQAAVSVNSAVETSGPWGWGWGLTVAGGRHPESPGPVVGGEPE